MFERLRSSLSGLVDKILKSELTEERLVGVLDDLRLELVENDVAFEVADQICSSLGKRLVGVQVQRFGDYGQLVGEALRQSLVDVLSARQRVDLLGVVAGKRERREPAVLVFVGVNGSGKTTTIAKVARLLQKSGFSVVLACGDTYRAGSIEQLEEHAHRLNVPLVKQGYGADAAAVAYDGVNYARVRGINAVLVDTAGRMQTNKNLMDEMRKIVTVVKPDLVVFVGDALTGNDAVEQAREFDRFVHIDASILAKADADAKGGSAVSIAHVTRKPVIYLGVGQGYDDLVPFDPDVLINQLFEWSPKA